MASSRFDRLAGWRRNRRMRNLSGAVAGTSFFVGLLLGVDPIVSGAPIRLVQLLGLAAIFVISVSAAAYYHMRFLTRE